MIAKTELKNAFFPKGSKITFLQWEEFEKILNLKKQGTKVRKRLFVKFATQATNGSDRENQKRNFVIAGYMLEQDPTLAILPLDHLDGLNFIEFWATSYPITKSGNQIKFDKCDQIVLNFVRQRAEVLARDVYVLFPSETLIGCFENVQPKFELAHVALENENFVKLINQQYAAEKDLAAGSFLHTLADFSLEQNKNIDEFSELVNFAIVKCPALLKIRNENRETVMERIEKFVNKKTEKISGQTIGKFVHDFRADASKKANVNFESFYPSLSLLCTPLLPVIFEAEKKCPDVLQTKDIDGTTLEERLGFVESNPVQQHRR